MVNNVTIQSCHQSAMDLLSPHLTQKSLCAHPPHVTPRLYSNANFYQLCPQLGIVPA